MTKLRGIMMVAAACCAVAGAGGLFLLTKARTTRGPRASGPMPGSVYVWQRVWNAPVREAVKTVPEWVDGLAPLAAEVTWRADGSPVVVWPNIDFAALRAAKRPTSAVLRIGPRKPTTATGQVVCGIARDLVKRFGDGNVTAEELQVDFDCAESQLAEYRAWLAELRTAVAPIPVRPTVLPSWLGRREFAQLARESGAYILQVHATERPRIDAAETALCEARRAREWVEQAARIGVPFRVALPTYTYLVGFAPDGQFLGIQAEGAARAWPAGTVVRVFRPSAADLSALVHNWHADRPASLSGLLWYRLPVANDALNWRLPTLRRVAAGEVPARRLRIETTGTSPVDLALVNDGEADETLPTEIVAINRGDSPLDADGVGGYQAEIRGREVIYRRVAAGSPALLLAPGGRYALGWLRTESEIEVHVR